MTGQQPHFRLLTAKPGQAPRRIDLPELDLCFPKETVPCFSDVERSCGSTPSVRRNIAETVFQDERHQFETTHQI